MTNKQTKTGVDGTIRKAWLTSPSSSGKLLKKRFSQTRKKFEKCVWGFAQKNEKLLYKTIVCQNAKKNLLWKQFKRNFLKEREI